MNRLGKANGIAASIVALITFIVYFPSLRNGFVNWDDNEYVYDNPLIRSLDVQLLKSALTDFHAANWHPLTVLSHAVDYALWGLNPLGHHLTNNILHALNAALVVILLARILTSVVNHKRNRTFLTDRAIVIAGAATGLLFGIHPLHVESVAWIAERKDLLCALFYLLAVIAYTYNARETAADNAHSLCFSWTYLVSIVFFCLALLSKPMAVTLPLVLFILDWHPFDRIKSLKTFWKVLFEKLPFAALSLMVSILTVLAQHKAMRSIEEVPFGSRLAVAAQSLTVYLQKMILPTRLVPFYPYPQDASLFSTDTAIAICAVAVITAACVMVRSRQRLWLSLWGFYVITLLPVLGIVQVGAQSMADRYTYLPSLGPFFAIGLISAGGYERASSNKWGWGSKTAGIVIAMSMVASLSYATVRQIGVWKNSIVFWNYVIDKEPSRVSFAHNNLGAAYASKKLFAPAIAQYHTALRIKPDYVEAYTNLGTAYLSQRMPDRAMEQFRAALRLDPDSASAHNGLGTAYQALGRPDLAIEEYRHALRLNPNFADGHNNLGIAYKAMGRIDMAMDEYRAALKLRPDFAEAHNGLGLAYKANGDYSNAIAEYRIALRLNPGLAEAYNNLGAAFRAIGRFDMAIEQYKTALQLESDSAEIHNNLGNAYASQGLPDMAREHYQAALRLKPDFTEARLNLGLLPESHPAAQRGRSPSVRH